MNLNREGQCAVTALFQQRKTCRKSQILPSVPEHPVFSLLIIYRVQNATPGSQKSIELQIILVWISD